MEKVNGRKLSLIFIFILILLVIALLVGKLTFSYLGPTLGEDLSNEGEVTASGDTLIFTKGSNLSLSATTDNFQTGGSNLSSTTNPKVRLIASSKTNSASATYYVGVVINSNTYTYTTSDKTAEVILTIKDENGNNVTSGVDGLTYVTSGGVSGFDVTGKTGLFNIKTDYPISTTSSSTGTTHTWTFTLTFVNLSTDQSDNENASMDLDIYLQKTKVPTSVAEACASGVNLADCIITLNDKSTSSVSNIYYHDSTLANGAGDNSYRYAGASESVNNYICLGSDVATCPDANLFRIIGVFGAQTKVIRAKSVGNKQWNTSDSIIWSSSSLNTYLNGEYLTSLGTLADKIATTTWKVGGSLWSNIVTSVPKTAYQYEVGSSASTTTVDKKIGLMYVSDYYYSASPSAWTLVGYNESDDATKDYRAATSTNWLYLGSYEWTISHISDLAGNAFLVSSTGNVGGNYVVRSSVARPSFNLESSVKYVTGSGSMSDPVRIK